MEIKYRTWFKGLPPRRIRLQRPGWSGAADPQDAMPWQCKPWLDGTTYGLELVYPFKSECRVHAKDGICEFLGDFTEEKKEHPLNFEYWKVPFSSFAPHHFGFTSSVDIQTPPGIGTMILPHPRYYTDRTGSVPCPVMGFLESDWWPKIFFIVFKAPLDGQEYVFRYGEGYATLLFLPKEVHYDVSKLQGAELRERTQLDDALTANYRHIASKKFIDSKGNPFDNKYKVLSSIAKYEGLAAVKEKMLQPHGSGKQMRRKMIWK